MFYGGLHYLIQFLFNFSLQYSYANKSIMDSLPWKNDITAQYPLTNLDITCGS